MTSIEVIQGNCLDLLRRMPDASIDAIVTDSPYGLSKEPDMAEVLRCWLAGDDYQHTGAGFMGKKWDSFVPGPSIWRECLRVLKPGGHMLVFFGTRTYDIGTLAIRLAGFQIRDQLAWMYGSGFPKSLNVAKQPGCEHMDGWGTALKPAQEPIVLARKPLVGTVASNVLAHGTGGINVDGCRIGMNDADRERARVPQPTAGNNTGAVGYMGGTGRNGATFEPAPEGRWPANVILDEHAAAVLDETARQSHGHNDSGGASRFFYCAKASKAERERGLDHLPARAPTNVTGRQAGSAGQSHARAGMTGHRGRRNHHPTVKPVALMRYLVRLITPPGGIVLDPFTGSGTTGVAAKLEGMSFLGFDLDPEYVEIATARIESAAGLL